MDRLWYEETQERSQSGERSSRRRRRRGMEEILYRCMGASAGERSEIEKSGRKSSDGETHGLPGSSARTACTAAGNQD